MPELLLLRSLTDQETTDLRVLAQGQKVEARLRDWARICWLSHEGKRVREGDRQRTPPRRSGR